MTACVNNQNENKGGVSHKVLRSVVAGAMAVSMVPSVALADTVVTESEVAPLASDQDAWRNIIPTYNVEADSKGNYSFAYTGKAVDFKVTKVSLVSGLDLEADEDYTVAFYTSQGTKTNTADNSGATTEGGAPSEPGNYLIGITGSSEYGSYTFYQPFKIKSATLEGVTLYQINGEDNADVSDTTFTFSGNKIDADNTLATDGDIWIAIDGEPVDPALVTVTIDNADNGATNVGDYKVKVKGVAGKLYDGMTKYLDLKVVPFDLKNATVEIDPMQSEATSTIDDDLSGAVISDGETELNVATVGWKITGFEGIDTDGVPNTIADNGEYTVSFSANTLNAENVLNTATGKFVVADYTTTIRYNNGTNFGTEDAPVVIADEFDPEKITVKYNNDSVTLDEDQYKVTVTKDGKEVDKYDASGIYKVQVDVITDENYVFAGKSQTMYFKYTEDAIKSAKTFVSVADKNISASSDAGLTPVVDYTGEAFPVSVVVKDEEGKVLTEGVDYEAQLYVKNSKNEYVEADSAMNAGVYKVEITSDTYAVNEQAAFYFEIDQATPTYVRVAGLKTVYKTGKDFADTPVVGLPYTGAEIVPVLEYTTATSVANAADDTVEWKALPAENYSLSYVDEDSKAADLVEAGQYKVTLTEINPKTADNFDLTGVAGSSKFLASAGVGNLNILDTTCFKDVKASDWFATAATVAANKGIFAGNDGGAFLPNAAMTRAEAVQVFSKMAQIDYENDDLVAKYIAVAVDSFDDVKATDWFAPALGWAKTVGLVAGNGEGSFNPADQITREQFAVMLANYETTFGAFEAAEGDVLAGYADADTVSSWAKNALAWAVENKIMGAGDTINAQGLISRAEAATMVVNYIG